MVFHLSQSISPGLVRTEFVARLMKNSDVKTVQDAMEDVCTVCIVDGHGIGYRR